MAGSLTKLGLYGPVNLSIFLTGLYHSISSILRYYTTPDLNLYGSSSQHITKVARYWNFIRTCNGHLILLVAPTELAFRLEIEQYW